MKKTLALLLVMVMVLSLLAGCNNSKPEETTGTTAPNAESTPTTAPVETEPTEPATYTYNSAMSVFPTKWNPHTYQTATDSDVLGYVSDGFYGFDYNEDKTGYKMVPFMTTDEHPVDITSEYVGKYGVVEGDSKKVYKINLRTDLMWQDGTPITAYDFVESAKRLINPVAQNYRADTLYSGSVKIYNAENYLKQGKTIINDNGVTGAYTVADLVKAEDGTYTTPEGGQVWIALGYPIDWCNGNSLADYYNAYGATYFGTETWDELAALMDDEGKVVCTEANLALLSGVTTTNPAWGETDDDLPAYLVYEQTYPELDFSEVGIFALSDYELVYALINPEEGFYLKYGLPSGYLVHIATYDACESVVDGVYTNTYGTTVDTTFSYGPYKMTAFQLDKEIAFERNEYYYDLGEGKYQTTHINIQFVEEPATRLEMFLSGDLDVYGLQAEDMDKYSLSDYCYYATGDSTFAMTFNPDLEGLTTAQANAGENINKTIITIPEFRMAMSFAMNRDDFCLATSPTNSAAFGLFSSTIISEPNSGISYRSTDVAKNTLAKFWGVSEEYGEGKLYADIDEAIESITGYNLTKAKELFDAAYDKAIAEGLMDADDKVEICVGIPSASASFYVNGYEFIVNNYTEAVKGTKLEGKLQFTKDDTIGNGFRDALNKSQVDLLFGVGWTGSALDPYGLMQAYVQSSYQYDGSVDYTAIDLTININGTNMTTDLFSWYMIMSGVPCTVKLDDETTMEYSCGTADNDPEARLQILGEMEGAVLLNYNFIPLMDDSSAQLKGQQIEYYHDEYIYGVGFGGIRYNTYNYTDAEWEEYVTAQGGVLAYN